VGDAESETEPTKKKSDCGDSGEDVAGEFRVGCGEEDDTESGPTEKISCCGAGGFGLEKMFEAGEGRPQEKDGPRQESE